MPRRHALVIGIDQYPNFPAKPLEGCVRDAHLMASLLRERFGFAGDELRLLLDREATEQGILRELDRLTEVVGPDDTVVFHYSGHGSRLADQEGDEPDGWDETIVPHDSGRSVEHRNLDITDDQIYDRLLPLTQRTADITLVFDSCHSGAVVRAETAVRYLPPDDRSLAEIDRPPVASALGRSPVEGGGFRPLGGRYVLVAGCHDNEVACEHRLPSGEVHGALTYFLCKELRQASGDVCWRDVFESVAAEVSSRYSRQTPQLEGAGDRRVFSGGHVPREPYFLVDPRGDDGIAVRAGAVHGLAAHALLDVFPPGSRRGDGKRVARIELTEVRATESTAVVARDGDGAAALPVAIAPASRAVEVAHDHRDMRLPVALGEGLEGEAADELVARLQRSPFLERVEPGSAAGEVVIHRLPTRQQAHRDDPVPQLGALARPAWAVVDRSGRLVLPVFGADTHALERLVSNLQKLARRRAVLELRNPTVGELHGKVDLAFRRPDGADGALPAERGPSGYPRFTDGDALALEIRNDSDRDLHCYVLDFGFCHGIAQIFPARGSQEMVSAHSVMKSGVRRGDEIFLSLPRSWPFDPGDDASGGLEPMKLIASTAPLDLEPLLQEGVRDLPASHGGGLAQLLTMALTGSGLRDASRVEHRPDVEWTTVTRTFELRRR